MKKDTIVKILKLVSYIATAVAGFLSGSTDFFNIL